MTEHPVFHTLYPTIKKSIVAIVSRVSQNPEFPPIIGTGFVVRSDGLIMTCKHVVDEIPRLPRRRDAPANEWPAAIYYLYFLPGKGMAAVPLDIVGTVTCKLEGVTTYYGEEVPDVSLIHANIKDLPTARIEEKPDYLEGAPIFVSGFPMGIRTLRAPGWLHQISPTLQRGIISAVLPFPCENPHALLLECVVEGGSSGSPVFNEVGNVIGMVYAGIPDRHAFQGASGVLVYDVPTAHTLAVPGHLLRDIVRKVDLNQLRQSDLPPAQSLSKLIEDAEREGRLLRREPKGGADPAMPPIDLAEIEPSLQGGIGLVDC